MGERWKPVEGWSGLYEVSDQGRVRAKARAVRTRNPQGMWCLKMLPTKLLKQARNRRGHRRVMLSVMQDMGGDRPRRLKLHAYVHKLVAEAFLDARPSPDHLVCHRNDRKGDNRAENLYYGTRCDNAQDALRNGCHGTERKRR